jgi:predicted transcriptional regulator
MVIDLAPEEQMELSQAAQDMQLSEADVTRQALRRFLASRTESYREAIREGDEDFANGDYLSHDEAVASFADVLRHL